MIAEPETFRAQTHESSDSAIMQAQGDPARVGEGVQAKPHTPRRDALPSSSCCPTLTT